MRRTGRVIVGMDPHKRSATIEVKSLAFPPTTSPANAQWNGRPTWWTMRPSTSNGRNRRVTIVVKKKPHALAH